jgi:hypothetical protein
VGRTRWLRHDCDPDPLKTKLLDLDIPVPEHTLIKSRFTTPFGQLLLMSVEQSGRVAEDCSECRRLAKMKYARAFVEMKHTTPIAERRVPVQMAAEK